MRRVAAIACSSTGWLAFIGGLAGVTSIVMPCTLGMIMLSSNAGAWLAVLIGGTLVMFLAAAALINAGQRLSLRPLDGKCRKCEYDLRGGGSDICPECGEPI